MAEFAIGGNETGLTHTNETAIACRGATCDDAIGHLKRAARLDDHRGAGRIDSRSRGKKVLEMRVRHLDSRGLDHPNPGAPDLGKSISEGALIDGKVPPKNSYAPTLAIEQRIARIRRVALSANFTLRKGQGGIRGLDPKSPADDRKTFQDGIAGILKGNHRTIEGVISVPKYAHVNRGIVNLEVCTPTAFDPKWFVGDDTDTIRRSAVSDDANRIARGGRGHRVFESREIPTAGTYPEDRGINFGHDEE